MALCGIGRSTIYEKINPKSKRYDESFPRPIKLSLSAVGWFEQDVIAWLDSKKVDQFSAISLQPTYPIYPITPYCFDFEFIGLRCFLCLTICGTYIIIYISKNIFN
jgi:prophage regulatory protein